MFMTNNTHIVFTHTVTSFFVFASCVLAKALLNWRGDQLSSTVMNWTPLLGPPVCSSGVGERTGPFIIWSTTKNTGSNT